MAKYSTWAGWTIFFEETGVQSGQMLNGSLSLINAVAPVGIGHELKLLVVLDQFIEEHIGILIMHVIVAGSMYIQQLPFESLCMRNG